MKGSPSARHRGSSPLGAFSLLRSCFSLPTLRSPLSIGRVSGLTALGAAMAVPAWAQPAVDRIIETIAGSVERGDGGAAAAAQLTLPSGVALDGSGNLYIADNRNHRIRKVDADGIISTVAGTGESGYGGDGAAATAARLYFPLDVAADGSGNLYIADTQNHRIRKVDAAGLITTVAGTGESGYGGDGAAATAAQLYSPYGVAVDGSGALYIADNRNHRIRKVDAAGLITTAAGTGAYGYNGDDIAATAAHLNDPRGVAVDGSGALYIADWGNGRIRKVDPAGLISTVAGNGEHGYGGDGGPATAAQINSPYGMAADDSGNLYIADLGNHRIRKVGPAGVISTAAGTGERGYGGDGGAATAARLYYPFSIAADGSGALYIADSENHRIRKVDAAGVVSTAAGNGEWGYSGDGGAATAAQITSPEGVAVDGSGNLYIADSGNNCIRKVDTAGIITTVAGTGTEGYSGDGATATAAQLASPQGMAVDGSGNLYIADTFNHSIRKVDAMGIISTVAGTGRGGDEGAATEDQFFSLPRDVAVDGSGNLYIANRSNHRIHKVDAAGIISTVAGTGTPSYNCDNGEANAAQLYAPQGVAVDGSGNLYIADSGNNCIRKVDAAGIISTVAGTGTRGYNGDGGPATTAQLNGPLGVAVDAAGNLYIADSDNARIRKVDAAGVISTVAGTGTRGYYSGEGGPATAARLSSPSGVAVDGLGNLYIADSGDARIRKVDAAGRISTVAGTGTQGYSCDNGEATAVRLSWPFSVAVDGSGNLYIADTSNNCIRKVDAAGRISTVAGTGTPGYNGDGGPATTAQLNGPLGVAVDGLGNLYIADSGNSRLRKVDATGIISTVAGTGTPGYNGDGGPAATAQLYWPYSVATDGSGNLYTADSGNARIRKVDAAGIISTAAGTGTLGYSGDGGPATTAQLNAPHGVTADGSGNLYIADSGNSRLRKVDAAGIISTIAGTGTPGYSGDGGPATAARLSSLHDVAVDNSDNIYIADAFNHRIRRLTPAPAAMPRISAGGVVLATGSPLVNRISPNALISVFGQDFAPQGTLALIPSLDAAGRVAANLAGACLEIDGKRAPLFAATPNQINAQAPHDLTPGEAQAAVVRDCGAGAELRGPETPVEIGAVSPAFFTVLNDPDGRNPLVAQHVGSPALAGAPSLGAEFTPAQPGELVTLFGTGFGAVEPPLATGQIPGAAANLANAVAFTVGGIAVPPEDVLYAGASPCCAGLYQFTLRLPADIPDGDAPIAATVNGVSTPAGPFLTVRRRQ